MRDTLALDIAVRSFCPQGYSVAFDPLDGSSIIDTNFAVGTIFGVWPGSRLVGVSGRELSAAGMAVYGPRTTMTVAGEHTSVCLYPIQIGLPNSLNRKY